MGDPASGELVHDTGGKPNVKRTLASWLYQVLYECRNDFLHGNPVERSNLVLSTPQRTIFEYAAPLYRMALTAFLPITYAATMPSADDPKAFGAFVVDRMDLMGPQKNAEEALLTAIWPPAERGARRPRVNRTAP